MLAIKLRRIGKKHQASYRIVVAEKRSKLRGRYVEDLGWFNPHSDQMKIEKDRAEYWLGVGARPTERVKKLFLKEKVVAKK